MGRLLLVLILLGGAYYIVSYLLAGLRGIISGHEAHSSKSNGDNDQQIKQLLKEVAQLREKLDEQQRLR